MFKRVSQIICAGGIAVLAGMGGMSPAMAAGGSGEIIEHEWTFDGPFGFFDKASLLTPLPLPLTASLPSPPPTSPQHPRRGRERAEGAGYID